MKTSPGRAATNSRRNGHARQTDSKRLTGDIKEERPSVTGKPPLYITLNCDCPILIIVKKKWFANYTNEI